MVSATVPFAGVDAAKTVMLCETKHSVAEAAAGHPSVLEPKLDGWRGLFSTVEGADGEVVCRAVTRSGKSLKGKMPAIEAALADALNPGVTLDGEVVAFDVEDGQVVHRWGRVQEILGSGTAKAALMSGDLTLVVFDVLALAGKDARDHPFAKRREALEKLFHEKVKFPPYVMLIPQLEATEAQHAKVLEGGYEGSVVKWQDAPYMSGVRGHGWFRLKPQTTVDVVLVGYKEGTPGSAFDGLVGAMEFAQYDPATGLLVPRGRCSGFDWTTRKYVSAHRDECLGRVFEMAHMGVLGTPLKDPFRHPQFKRWLPAKSQDEAVLSDG